MNEQGRPTSSNPGRSRRGFVSTSPATRWDAGLLVGSGRVGAVLWGDPAEHRISIAHERFFLPTNPRPLPPDLVGARHAARRALLAGDPEAAATLIDDASRTGSGELVWTDPLAPCAALTIRVEGASSRVADYERSVDFDLGIARVTWRAGVEKVQIETRSPRGSQRVEVAVRARPGRRIDARLLTTGAADEPPLLGGAGDEPAIEVRTSSQAGSYATLTVTAPGLVPGTGRRATTRVTAEGAAVSLETRGEAVHICATIPADGGVLFTLETEITGPTGSSPRMLELGEHEALQRASWLDLASDIEPSVPTERLHELAAADEQIRRALVELTYAAGRYAIISSTGELPATLQGVWQGTWAPAWSSDYTMNGNVQNGGVASLVPTGTPELIRALTRLLTPHIEDYRVNARRLFGFQGAMLPTRMSTHGLANHFSHDYPHQYWVGAGGWVLRLLADAVMATGDRTLVDDETWALAVEIMRFYSQVAAEGPIAPGYSPENTPRGHTTPLSVQPTMDSAILRDAPRAFRVLAEARGQDSLESISYPVPKAAYRIAPDGLLAEWQDDRFADELAHRHTSQLYPLWYEPDEALDASLLAAAGRLVQAKIAWRASDTRPPPGHMEMAFGLAQLGLAAAALGDSQAALQCVEWLALAHFTVAMTSTHDAGEIFNVDASGALPALVAAMLVQSTRSSISLLPALPTPWRTGGAGGMTTRTGLLVEDLHWDADGVTAVLQGRRESAWVRRDGVSIRLPWEMRMRTATGWTAPATVFHLGHTDHRELEFLRDGHDGGCPWPLEVSGIADSLPTRPARGDRDPDPRTASLNARLEDLR